MAYDTFQAERIRTLLDQLKITYEEKKMMGGWCVMMNDKMLCGLLQNKTDGRDILMARIGAENNVHFLKDVGASPMNFTGRTMRGFLFVDVEGFDRDEDLEKWIKRCIAFNPHAKSSKK